jgi:hypothetical protein
MAALSGNRVAWGYTDDRGVTWRVSAEKAVTDQAKSGGAAALASVPGKPADIKMRRMTVNDGAGHSRTTPIYSTGAALLAPGSSVDLNFNGNTVTFFGGRNLIPERRPRDQQTSQQT